LRVSEQTKDDAKKAGILLDLFFYALGTAMPLISVQNVASITSVYSPAFEIVLFLVLPNFLRISFLQVFCKENNFSAEKISTLVSILKKLIDHGDKLMYFLLDVNCSNRSLLFFLIDQD
jgi:hypothetical protein